MAVCKFFPGKPLRLSRTGVEPVTDAPRVGEICDPSGSSRIMMTHYVKPGDKNCAKQHIARY